MPNAWKERNDSPSSSTASSGPNAGIRCRNAPARFGPISSTAWFQKI